MMIVQTTYGVLRKHGYVKACYPRVLDPTHCTGIIFRLEFFVYYMINPAWPLRVTTVRSRPR
jgi:hypothetical protein